MFIVVTKYSVMDGANGVHLERNYLFTDHFTFKTKGNT